MKRSKFKHLNKKDADLIKSIESSPLLKTYWKNHPERAKDFKNLQNDAATASYFLYSLADKPTCLLILCPLHKDKEEPLAPWIDEEGNVYSIEMLSLHKSTKEQLSEVLISFFSLSDEKRTFLADPEVKEEEKIEALEASGFKRVGSLVKGKGFFKGTPHHIMKRLPSAV